MLPARTGQPGVYRRGKRYVVKYRVDGRQRTESAATFAQARELKFTRDAEARERRRGPTFHAYALGWVARYPGRGHDTTRERTRAEYRRLLTTFAFGYFEPTDRLGEIDRTKLQGFITWLIDRPGRKGRLSDSSVRNVLAPVRMCLNDAADAGLLDPLIAKSLVLPKRRGGRRWHVSEARYLTRDKLRRLLAEIPAEHEPFFVLLALTGLRISEAIALRWRDIELDRGQPRVRVRRAIVKGVLGAPKSRHGVRTVPISNDITTRLRAVKPAQADPDALAFPNEHGRPLNTNNLRNRILAPARERAGIPYVTLHAFRHTCASLLIDQNASLLKLQRWMGHHSAAYTHEAYGHLLEDDLGNPLQLDDILGEQAALRRPPPMPQPLRLLSSRP